MTISEPNPDVRPTGEEAAEFIEPPTDAQDEEGEQDEQDDIDPKRRPSKSPPA